MHRILSSRALLLAALLALAAGVAPVGAIVRGRIPRSLREAVARRIIVLYGNDTTQAQIADVRATFGQQFPGGALALALNTDAAPGGATVTAAPLLANDSAPADVAVAADPAIMMDVFDSSAVAAAGGAVTAAAAESRPTDDQIAALRAMPGVVVAERDGIATIKATQSGATWGLDRVDQRALPLTRSYVYPDAGGLGATVYVIDTGIRTTHTQFGGRATFGYSAITNEANTDLNGHGTHCAGTIAGSTYGVAKRANLVAVKVLSKSGSGSTSGVIAGINWAVNDCTRNRAGRMCVISMSLGGSISSALDTAVTTAVNRGIVAVVAAGNDNANACNYSPARAGAAVTVGSTTSADRRSSFSNYGACVDLFAPGTSITSAWHTSNTASNVLSGTSMATPHVAGAAALRWSTLGPATTAATVWSQLSAATTPSKITNVGTNSPNKLLYTQ